MGENVLKGFSASQAQDARAKHADLIGEVDAQTQTVLADIRVLVDDLSKLEQLEQVVNHQAKEEILVIKAAVAIRFERSANLRLYLEGVMKAVGQANEFRTAEA